MFDRSIRQIESRFRKFRSNLGYSSLFETIGKYTFIGLITISIIQVIVYSLRG